MNAIRPPRPRPGGLSPNADSLDRDSSSAMGMVARLHHRKRTHRCPSPQEIRPPCHLESSGDSIAQAATAPPHSHLRASPAVKPSESEKAPRNLRESSAATSSGAEVPSAYSARAAPPPACAAAGVVAAPPATLRRGKTNSPQTAANTTLCLGTVCSNTPLGFPNTYCGILLSSALGYSCT